MKIDHWMTFSTFAEQRFFIHPTPDTYKGVIINANMVAHAPAGIATFLMEKTQNLNFIIDPLTHAFQHDIKYIMSGEEVKSSIGKLAEEYGSIFSDNVGKKPIHFSDFNDIKKRKEMATRCINFQRKKIQSFRETEEIDKYLTDSEKILEPYAVVAPYFYLTEINYKNWLPLMKECVSDALEIKETKEKLFVAIVISQGVLSNRDIINKISSSFSNVDGFLIWIDNFDEQNASISQLKDLIHLCQKLKKVSKTIINLHGGYFSVLMAGNLGKSLLSGVAHGPEFGEYRSVVPVGGGIPIAKYYIPKLHARIKYRDALSIFQMFEWLKDHETFYKHVCSCCECKKVISNNIDNFTKFRKSTVKEVKRKNSTIRLEYPIRETKERCLRHYLNVKKHEYIQSAKSSKEELLNQLKSNKELFEPVVGIDFISYLEKWKRALDS